MIASRHRRGLAIALVLAAITVGLSACSIPARPAWWPRPAPRHSSSPAAKAASPATGAARLRDAVPAVARPWRPGMTQLGIDVYWVANRRDSAAVIRAKARRIIDYAISLGANSISLTFPFYTLGITSDTVYASPATTPSPASVALFLAAADAARIRVTLRAVLNEDILVAQDPLAWRGSIEPASRAAWFASYARFLLPYAAVAQAGHALTFVISTELESLEGDAGWAGLVRAVRSVFHGQLIYDENFDEFALHTANPPVPDIGVDAYPRFDLPDGATIGQLAGAWEDWLSSGHPLGERKAIVLSEVGIAAVSGAYADPAAWLGTVSAPIVPDVQRNWFQAACLAVAREHVGGIYWWEISFDADPARPGPFESDRLTFLDRPAQRVIRACFVMLAGGTGPSPG
jgi:hypothetical protein